MIHITTAETAQQLKDAGYKQPDFSTGQFWYNTYSALTFIGVYCNDGYFQLHSLLSGRSKKLIPCTLPEDAYAPTATEIMQKLGQRFVLWFDDSPKIMQWVCCQAGNSIHEAGEPILHPNPAECAAQMWLHFNGKKSEQ